MAEVPPVESLLEHAGFARRLARALVGDAARADDVVQSSWLAALQHPPKPGRGLKAWFGAVVRNAAARVRREEARRVERERRAAVPERLPATVDVAAQLSAQRALLDAVARLDEPYRSTIHARFFEERTPTAIAAASGVPVRTVERRLRRAIARLRVDLDARFEGGRAAWAGLLLGGGAVATSSKAVGVGFAAAVALAVVATTWIVQATGERSTHAAGPPAVPSASATASPLAPAADAPLPAAAVAGASPGALRESARCNVSVVTPEGVAVAGATLVRFRGDGTGRRDDRRERRTTLPRDADAWLYVVPGCAPPRVVDVAAGAPRWRSRSKGRGLLGTRDGREARSSDRAPIHGRRGPVRRVPMPSGTASESGVVRLRSLARTDLDSSRRFRSRGAPEVHDPWCRCPTRPQRRPKRGSTSPKRARTRDRVRRNPTIRGRLLDRMGEPLARWHIEAGCSRAPSPGTSRSRRQRRRPLSRRPSQQPQRGVEQRRALRLRSGRGLRDRVAIEHRSGTAATSATWWSAPRACSRSNAIGGARDRRLRRGPRAELHDHDMSGRSALAGRA